MVEKFIPKSIPNDNWKKLEANVVYAIRLRKQDKVKLRLGAGVGLYLVIFRQLSEGLMVKMVAYETGDAVADFPVGAGKNPRIGRTDDCLIKIKHAIVSRLHAEMKLKEDILILQDFGSTNGTFLNAENAYFNIDDYLSKHPIKEKSENETLDYVHMEFGPAIDDFLKEYQKEKQG